MLKWYLLTYHESALLKVDQRQAGRDYYFTWIFKKPQERVGKICETVFVHPLWESFVECYQSGGQNWGFRWRTGVLGLTWYWDLVPRWNPRTHPWTLDQSLITSCHSVIQRKLSHFPLSDLSTISAHCMQMYIISWLNNAYKFLVLAYKSRLPLW